MFQIERWFIERYLPDAGVVVDVGGGPGLFAVEIARLGCEVCEHHLTPKLGEQARQLACQLGKSVANAEVNNIEGFSQMGSGSLPAQNLATTLVAVRPEKISAESLARQLRQYGTPIFSRIQNDRVLIDPRTMLTGDDEIIVKALSSILGQKN